MAKRKQQNLEIERQVKKRQLIFRIVAIGIAAIFLAATAIGIWTVQDRRWIMRYDGGRVATADFRVIFDRQFENNPAARSAAIQTLQGLVMIIDRAEEHDMILTAEERAEHDEAERAGREELRQFQGFDHFAYISVERTVDLFHTGPLIDRLIDLYVPTYTIDEEEFDEIWEAHEENDFQDFWDIQTIFLFLESEDEIIEAYGLIDTMPFEDLIRQFDVWVDDETEITPMGLTPDHEQGQGGLLTALQQMMLSEEDREALLALQAGETSGIIEVLNMEIFEPAYIIVHVLSRDDEVDLNEAKNIVRDNMILAGRHETFHELVLTWVEEANFRINQRGYNNV